MCGIAGIVSLQQGRPPQPDELAAMVQALQHRGPDGNGTHIDGNVGFAHARLSIIDLAGGHQPIHNETRDVWITFNGEIFNHIELRRDLERRGHAFYTHSDTEVIVHLYEQHGDDFVQHLNGQFAIALWDARAKRLVLARDRTGIRPLFHATVNGRLLFASEAKALFAVQGVPRRLDPLALAEVFTFWAPVGSRSVFEGVQSLPPGHIMVMQGGKTSTRCYWDWDFPTEPIDEGGRSAGDYADELRELMIDAVRLQLRADVPVGAYLSGGLDSSIITSLIHNFTDTPLRTFSVTFEDDEFDESAHQQQLVDYLGTQHSQVRCTRADIAAAFPRALWHAEAPILRTAPTPLMLLSASVHEQGYKVVLTGEGADEVFGGYDIFKEARVRRFMARASVGHAAAVVETPVSVPETFAGHQRRVCQELLQRRHRAPERPVLRAHPALEHDGAHLAVLLGRPARRHDRLVGLPGHRGDVAVEHPPLAADGARPVRRGAHAHVGLSAQLAGRPHGHGQLHRRPFSVP